MRVGIDWGEEKSEEKFETNNLIRKRFKPQDPCLHTKAITDKWRILVYLDMSGELMNLL